MNEEHKPCGCEATITESDPRAEIWLYVFGKRSFPLKHPLCRNGFYEGHATVLTKEQRQRLIEAMTKKFGITEKDVTDVLDKGIVPIKADNVIVSICNLHFRCMM